MSKSPKQVDPGSYNAFIEKLELVNLRLVDATVQANIPKPSGELEAKLSDEYSFVLTEEGFEAYAAYKLFFYREDQLLARLEATFGLMYISQATPEEIEQNFELFKQASLPLNAWPFAREFIYNMLGRMGWPPFTLPLLKVLPPASPEEKKRTTRRKKTKSE